MSNFIKKLTTQYKGKWIAIKGGKLISISESHREIYKMLKEQNLNGTYVFYSPTEKEKKYGFLFNLDRNENKRE